jgi:hypothetical protein
VVPCRWDSGQFGRRSIPRDSPEGELASGERSLVLRLRWSDGLTPMLTNETVRAE